MDTNELYVTNSLTGNKERFVPIHENYVGMYVCGPTVYNNVHLGNCRTFISFDLIFRYLTFLGYKVRYVRNITDVGHLENDSDDGEDKMLKKALLEQIEPMEVAQKYTVDFHETMRHFNTLPPSIEPNATGHIMEQIALIKKIIENGMAYESQGSVYFDVGKYNREHNYGALSGRNIEELETLTRDLKGSEEKRNSIDFALWKNATPSHIMNWESPWGKGFPAWHLECSAMSQKYLGKNFDIHGGGMDLKFPHHECEIAQSVSAFGHKPVNYWLHTNMLTLNQKRMSKSNGNYILPQDLFSGNNDLFSRPFSPEVVKFYMFQAHYAGTLDLSEKGLEAAAKALHKLQEIEIKFEQIKPVKGGSVKANSYREKCFEAMNDDFNSPKLISVLFEIATVVKKLQNQKLFIETGELEKLKQVFHDFFISVLGFNVGKKSEDTSKIKDLMDVIIDVRKNVREKKDYELSDYIRDKLQKINIKIKDEAHGTF